MTDNAVNDIAIWDPLVRLFHWLLVFAFALSYFSQGEPFENLRERLLTEETWQDLHVWSGYAIAALLLFRLAWGFMGPRYARFSDFVQGPRATLRYLRQVLTLRARRYLGHNPAGGAMIVILLLSLTVTVAAGLALYGADKGLGPLAGALAGGGERMTHTVKEIHEFFANFTVILVIGHLIGVAWESGLHRENLAWAMITGRKRA